MKKAFSLVELSIVLVILGLLAGGIVAGQSLIRASELRAVAKEFQQYQTAVHTFRDKYMALPGDMKNATDFWGVAGGTGSNNACYTTDQSVGTATCNGSQNSLVFTHDVSTANAESYLFWKHLANAGLIEGVFSGTTAASGSLTSPYTYLTTAYPGWNMPLSRLNSGTWWVGNSGGANVALQKFYGNFPANAMAYYHNSFHLFSASLSPYAGAGGPLSPEEAWALDTKLDDGIPGSGKVEAFRGGSSGSTGSCLTSGDPALAQYDLDDTGNCVMVFVNAF